MENPNIPVSSQIALMKVKEHLAALRNAPDAANNAAWAQLATTLQSCAVSVQHADSILSVFDDFSPTPKQIKEVALNTRAKFLPPQLSQKEQWEKEYGPPDRSFYAQVQQEFKTVGLSMVTEHERMWQGIKAKLMVSDFANIPWGRIYAAKRDLGFPLIPFEEDILENWQAAHPPKQEAPPGPITAEDVQRELANRKPRPPVVIPIKPERDEAKENLEHFDDGYDTEPE